MRHALVFRRHAALTAALCGMFVAHLASAQASDAGAAPSSPAPTAQESGPLLVWIDARDQAFDRAGLQASLARELGRPITFTADASAAVVQIRVSDPQHADVHYATPSGEQLSRSVELPPDRKRAVQVVSWLTVNLVRDEASELLQELRARRKEEAEARAAAADKAAADKAAADKAAADKAAADKAVADKAATEAARKKAAQNAQRAPLRDQLLRDPRRSVDAAVATPLSLLPDSPKRELHLQLALGYGDAGAIRGIAFSPGALRMRRDLLGIAFGAGAILVGGDARGILAAAGYSQLDGNLEGIQFGGGAAFQRGPFARGAVLSGGGASAGNLTGSVLGGAFATARSLRGVGVSGGATIIRGKSEGLLLAGGATVAVAHRGLAIAVGVSTAGELEGASLALVNVHRRVKGLQLGIVNIAEEVDGAAIGLISIAKNGRVQPVLWGSPDGSVHVAIKSLAGWVFTELGSGIDLRDDEFSYDGGIGAHLKLGAGFFLEPSVHYSATHQTADVTASPDAQQLHYLLQLGFRLANKLDLLAAGGVGQTIAGGSGATLAPEFRGGIAFF